MPTTYEITAPDGSKYRVTGEGSEADARAEAHRQWMSQFPIETDPKKRMRTSMREELASRHPLAQIQGGIVSGFIPSDEGEMLGTESGWGRAGKVGMDVAAAIPAIRGASAVTSAGRAALGARLALANKKKLAQAVIHSKLPKTLGVLAGGGLAGAATNLNDPGGGAVRGVIGAGIPAAGQYLPRITGDMVKKAAALTVPTAGGVGTYHWLTGGKLPNVDWGRVGGGAALLGAGALSQRFPGIAQPLGYAAAQQF